MDAWLGHSGRVSEKHYLMIPDELWDKAARWVDPSAAKCAAESAAHGTCTEAQEIATTNGVKDMASQGNTEKQGISCDSPRELETSGARGRTGDLGFMNPTL